jgi:4-amino-4-deoxy-L-arabinose transferase-like glycosyltransferase
MQIAKRHQVGLSLCLILVLALLLRVWGIGYDLPYIYHADEPTNITISQRIFRSGDLNPHFFRYPSLFFYINASAHVPYYLIGKLLGVFQTPQDVPGLVSLAMGITQAPMPGIVLMGRLITVLLGLGSVALIFWAGMRLSGRAEVGMLAALLLALSPIHVWHNRLVTPDTLVAFCATATLAASVLVLDRGTIGGYLLAGACVGLTAASKYNGGIVILLPIFAHFTKQGIQGIKSYKLYLIFFTALLAFLVTNPFALLDYSSFLHDITAEVVHYSSGHAGMEGNTPIWYITYLMRTTGAILPLAVLQIVRGAYGRKKGILLAAIFPVCYFIMIARFAVRNDRTLLPMTPHLFLLAAWLLVDFLAYARQVRPGQSRRLLLAVSGVLIATAILFPTIQTVQSNVQLGQTDSREAARVWINDNLPPGAKIALEPYSPFIDTERFSFQVVGKMVDHDPQWYIDNGFDYLVFGYGMFGRFYLDPERYRDTVQRYEAFFERFALVKLFDANGYEVRVYAVRDE